jgi:ParB family chromosome partitioning protein
MGVESNGTSNGHDATLERGGVGGLAVIAEQLRPLAVPIGSVNLDPANARRHPERNLATIRASLERWGQRLPIVVQREGMVVRAGNGRVEAMRAMGWTHVAALIVDESAVEATAFAIADNRSAELAEWDDQALATMLQGLPSELRLGAGFSENDLSELLRSLGNGILPGTIDDQGRLDQKAPTICPECGHEWVA